MTTESASIVAVVVAFLVLTVTSVVLRSLVRIRILKSFGLDDSLMVLSLALFVSMMAMLLRGVHYGIGRHNSDLDAEQIVEALKYQTLIEVIYIADSTFIKLSIAVFLLRIATRRQYTWILWSSGAGCSILCLVAFFYLLFQCRPIQFAWDRSIEGGSCVSPSSVANVGYAFSGMTILVDWLYALLPIPMIWSLNMSPQMKGSVGLILGLGVLGSIATIVRLKYLVGLTQVDDLLFAISNADIWSIVEAGISITVASIATLRPLLRHYGVSGFGKRTRSGGDTWQPTDLQDHHTRYRAAGVYSGNNQAPMKSPNPSSCTEPGQKDDASEDYILLEESIGRKPS